jgi:hypothetical protein
MPLKPDLVVSCNIDMHSFFPSSLVLATAYSVDWFLMEAAS